MTIKILDPTVSAEESAGAVVAKRVADLDGKVLGLLHNGKVNGDHLLALVREELTRAVRRAFKQSTQKRPTVLPVIVRL